MNIFSKIEVQRFVQEGFIVKHQFFDALFWSPEYEYSEFNMGDMLHDKERLEDWMQTVPDPEGLES